MRYTKEAVRNAYREAVRSGLFPESSTLSICAPGDGALRVLVYNTEGIDSVCVWIGAKAAYEGIRILNMGYLKGVRDTLREYRIRDARLLGTSSSSYTF